MANYDILPDKKSFVKDFWQPLSANEKQRFVLGTIIITLLLINLIAILMTGR